jgi:hypothetical protein
MTIEVEAELLMVTPEWVRRLTKDGWITKTVRGVIAWSTSCRAARALKRGERNAPLSSRV